jgi:hypothetical protein
MTDTTTTELRTLYHQAFRDYGTIALWNMRPVADPTRADALAITRALRTHGRRLAEQIEAACRAADEALPASMSGAEPEGVVS